MSDDDRVLVRYNHNLLMNHLDRLVDGTDKGVVEYYRAITDSVIEELATAFEEGRKFERNMK